MTENAYSAPFNIQKSSGYCYYDTQTFIGEDVHQYATTKGNTVEDINPAAVLLCDIVSEMYCFITGGLKLSLRLKKINEREDKLGLKTYSYAPQISAVVQSGNLYVYAVGNPVMYADEDGEFALTTAKLLAAAGHGLFNDITKYIEYKDTGKNALVGFAFGFAGGFASSFLKRPK